MLIQKLLMGRSKKSWYVDTVHNLSKEFTPKWLKKAQSPASVSEPQFDTLSLDSMMHVLHQSQASNCVVIDLKTKCDYADTMIICEGRSKRQIYAIADNLRCHAKKFLSVPPTIQGGDSEDWMVVDMGNTILHCFTPEARLNYDLDSLWTLIHDPTLSLSKEEKAEMMLKNWKKRPEEVRNIKEITEKQLPNQMPPF